MKRSPISAGSATLNVVIITLDHHMSGATDEARAMLGVDLPKVSVSLHAATDWGDSDTRLEACRADVAAADIIVVSMLFLEDHIKAILPDLEARRDHCDAMVCLMSAQEVVKLTRLGKFDMAKDPSGVTGWLKKLRGKNKPGMPNSKSSGEKQMKMLRRLPKLLKFVPGTAQDVRSYFLAMQYRLAASPDNIANLVRMLVSKYGEGAQAETQGMAEVSAPIDYPETGVYHPDIEGGVSADLTLLPRREEAKGTVGLLVLRSYLLAGDTGHYDGAIRALEAKGLDVVPVFCNGLDNRPAMDRFFANGVAEPQNDARTIDALVSLTGFSLVGGPAYSDSESAAKALAALDVPYLSAHVTEFQSLTKWEASKTGLLPIESTIMVAIPELDGATGSIVYGGREVNENVSHASMQAHGERVSMLAARVSRMVKLRRTERAKRRIALTIFNFPPNAGNTGSAAFLSVFESLTVTMQRMKDAGYDVGEIPADADALREAVTVGNAADHGALANVHHLISTDDHVRREPYLDQIEAAWGPAPGRDNTNGSSIFVLGKQFGNLLIAVQPGFGYEGDPMRLLFENGFAPTHAFSAFYRYLREDFDAHAVLHFGTHGALEFMPGKQVGMSEACWSDRLIGDLPNLYLYAANNPSEGTIAKRRSAATLVSYLTPPVTQAGLYKGLTELKASLDKLRQVESGSTEEAEVLELVLAQAEQLDLADDLPRDALGCAAKLSKSLIEMEQALIPHGLHVLGRSMGDTERREMLALIADGDEEAAPLSSEALDALSAGETPTGDDSQTELIGKLVTANANMADNAELIGLMTALDGRFVAPSPSGDLIRTPDMLPTGRNIHGFDPFRIPSAYAVRDGARQAARVLARYLDEDHALPETIAVVLWGTDNLKTEGAPMAQALALIGARPRHDSYGRVTGAELIALDELKRPRIDVVASLSGIFRDLLPIQAAMLAEASWLAATADEDVEQNFVRKHALAYAAEHGCDIDEAAFRVFSNAEGAYGANVNFLVSSGAWDDEDELAETYSNRKNFAIDRKGKSAAQPAIHDSVMGQVEMAYQNLDSVELGVTTIDHYFDTLGGISRAVAKQRKARGDETTLPVFISDQTQGEGKVRSLGEQVSLETRTRSLNPKWFDSMLDHGFEGVREIENQITNTMGWSATTGEVQPWVYQKMSETFVLDDAMRERLAQLNPASSSRLVSRLIEAHERDYWNPDDETLDALQRASEELEDRLEGIETESVAS